MQPIAFRAASATCAALVLAGIAGCSSVAPKTSSGAPSVYESQSAAGATLDKQAAAAMITELRRGKGLAPVALDPALNRMAEQQAGAMARAEKLSHSTAAGSLKDRIAASGYRNGGMWENIGAGHDNLADAFTGWRSSPPHLRNMLEPAARRIGIAAAKAPGSRYEVFWALVIADPNDPRPMASTESGRLDAAQTAQLGTAVPNATVVRMGGGGF